MTRSIARLALVLVIAVAALGGLVAARAGLAQSRPLNIIPQGHGGDSDGDNNGAPSDGDEDV